MNIDVTHTPFSRSGSYFAFSRLIDRPGVPDGLYFRTVHGGAKVKEIFGLRAVGASGAEGFEESATPGRLSLVSEAGTVEFCIDETDRVLVEARGASVELDALARSDYDLIIPLDDTRWQYICYGSDMNLVITVHEGSLHVDNDWTGVKSSRLVLRLDPSKESGRALVSFAESGTGSHVSTEVPAFEDVAARAEADFARFRALAPTVPAEYTATAELAAYVNWTSTVAPRGHIRRPVMFMSKNWMTNVWAWDHCFNAMSLTANPRAAMDQFLCIFDYQDELGGIPDSVNDSFISSNFTKPAVHGWALQWMLDRTDFDLSFLSEAYAVLENWTAWWFSERDYSGDGVPAYNHGNDSGWDNSTVFAPFVPVKSPDQIAFLVIQLETLSTLATRLGDDVAAVAWKRRSRDLLDVLVRDFWVDGRFVARHALTGDAVVCDSLLMYVPLVLGDRLPAEIFTALADGLTSQGFLTEFGLATESTSSPFYESDGYWRGPIWAPSTMLIVDGLRRGGRGDLAADIARRFCELAGRSGMAENYDAISGDGLRDRAYTWTSSVFLVLASEYLADSP